ncbi:MAG: serine/threonine-protein kinase [Planctomycetota bacterium]
MRKTGTRERAIGYSITIKALNLNARHDSNLLLAALAHQRQIISPEQLADAMAELAAPELSPRNQPSPTASPDLGDVLLRRGAIDAHTLAQLRDQVQQQVASNAQHRGNDQEDNRDHFQTRVGPPDTNVTNEASRAELRSNHPTPLDTQLVDSKQPASLPQAIRRRISDRYHVLRAHAKGGIGEVFVAEDRELSREVALKELQADESENPNSRARFLLEAEITGSLEHPGIVPVYGLGSYIDGRPYYAMRFIQGETLHDAIERFHDASATMDLGQRRFHLHKLLRRFIDVCNAMHYAHSRGVLHRDLKPANIMLGRFGETLVVDWGLAKAGSRSETDTAPTEPTLKPRSASGSNPTRAGSVFGTPAYMPPEQATGDVDRLGVHSDVYSLGATLYHLLVGHAPVSDRSASALFERIKKGEFPSPIEVHPNTPRPLNAICCKALALRPEQRYETAGLLGEDVEHWLADEPVRAYAERWTERVRRWTRHHQTLVGSGIVGAIVSLACLSIGLWVVNGARQREATARQLAEERFQLARNAVDRFYVQVSEEVLLDEPGLQPVRRELLQQALTYYQDFVSQRGDDTALRGEVAIASFRVGAILEQLQSPGAGLNAYQRAHQMQELLVEQTNAPTQRAAWADTLNAIGRVYHQQARFQKAESFFVQSLNLRRANAQANRGDLSQQRKLASSLMNVAIVRRQQGDPEQGYDLLREAQTHRFNLLNQFNDDADGLNLVKRDLAMGHYNEAVCHMQDGNRSESERCLVSAVEAFLQVLERSPRDTAVEQNLAQSLNLLGDRRMESSDFADAREHYTQAIEMLDTLTVRNPDVIELRSRLAATHMNLANAFAVDGLLGRAESSILPAVEILRGLVEQSRDVPRHRRDLAVSLRTLAAIEANRNLTSAQSKLEEAVELLERLVDQFPDEPDYTFQLQSTRQTQTRVLDLQESI